MSSLRVLPFLGSLFLRALWLSPGPGECPDWPIYKVPSAQGASLRNPAPAGCTPQRALSPQCPSRKGQVRGTGRWGSWWGLSSGGSLSGGKRSCREGKPPPLSLLLAQGFDDAEIKKTPLWGHGHVIREQTDVEKAPPLQMADRGQTGGAQVN